MDLVRTIDRFWGGVAADCDPQFDGVEVDYENITSGKSLMLDYLVEIFQGESKPGGRGSDL